MSNRSSSQSDSVPDNFSETHRSLSPKPPEVDRRRFLKIAATTAGISSLVGPGCMLLEDRDGAEFQSEWPTEQTRYWVGPSYWTNPLQDWRLAGGRVEMIGAGTDRNVQHLTRQIQSTPEGFELQVYTGFVADGRGRAGFEIGIQGPLQEYRNNAIHGTGLKMGVTSDQRLFIGDTEIDLQRSPGSAGVRLHLRSSLTDSGHSLVLTALGRDSENELGQVERNGVPGKALTGNLALFGDFEDPSGDRSWGDPRLWFRGWRGEGPALRAYPERTFGPILFSQYTLSRGVLKMTAQLPPMGPADASTVRLQTDQGGAWKTVASAEVHDRARTATVRVEDWDDTRDVPYRLMYDYQMADGRTTHFYEGVVRRDPVAQEEIAVGGFSCAKDTAFPHPQIVEGAKYHDPDVLAFTGDQYYEDTGGYGVQRTRDNLERATLDVLRKWALHGWTFGEMMRDRPTICLLDDHDVYHGNLWGEGGKQVDRWELHDNGGYFMPPEWVNAVQRMQTAHLPDPHDPEPVRNKIGVYYTEMLYGRISFALLEDRKWKTGPDGVVPPNPGRPDHIEDPDFDPSTVDLSEARLLGERQLTFLEEWAGDWRGADMKMVVSQSSFAQVPTHHGGTFKPLVADLDSNGWPQTPRDEALRKIRKAFAVHLGGDQHLPMLVRYGIENWNDAPYNFCVPGIAVGYVRAFWPGEDGGNPRSDVSYPTGQYTDGLGNKVTVRAVANPKKDFSDANPLRELANKSSGYGLLRFDKASRKITAECWPILSDPAKGDSEQYAGWPQTFAQEDNDPRAPIGHLPPVSVSGTTDPMIQIIDEEADEVVYTLRIQGQEFQPPVYQEGAYTVRVGDDEEWHVTRTNVRSGDDGVLTVSL